MLNKRGCRGLLALVKAIRQLYGLDTTWLESVPFTSSTTAGLDSNPATTRTARSLEHRARCEAAEVVFDETPARLGRAEVG